MNLLNKQIKKLTGYPFDRLRSLLANTNANSDVIDMSIGQPMHKVPNFIKDIIYNAKDNWNAYPPLSGIPGLQTAYLDWLQNRFKVDKFFDERNIIPLSGTREGLFSIAITLNTKQICLPNPFYQVYLGPSLLDNIQKSFLISNEDNNFLFDLKKLKQLLQNNPSLVYFCSPSNPQGKIASYEYMLELIKIIRFYNSVLIVDECYIDIFYEKVPIGALEVCYKTGKSLSNILIFHSLSKRSNAAGLRSGFLIGDAKIINSYRKFRSYSAPTIPIPIQLASVELWKNKKHVLDNRKLYKKKVKYADKVLKDYDFYNSPEAGFFLWLKVKDGENFTKHLYSKYAIKVMPGEYLAYGKNNNPGKEYVRVALVHTQIKNNKGLNKIAKLLL